MLKRVYPKKENREELTEKTAPDVATELRNLQQTVRRMIGVSMVLFFLLWAFVAYLLTERPGYAERLWLTMSSAVRHSDFERARRIAQTAVKQYPRDDWSHEWLVDVDREMNDFAEADTEYQRAYELVPSERIKKRLQEVRKRRQSNTPIPTSPMATP